LCPQNTSAFADKSSEDRMAATDRNRYFSYSPEADEDSFPAACGAVI
jgi:hypothetical protein